MNTAYPKISIVTPSFNQGHYLEETIQSVLSQEYPNLEYIIMDGGSSDASREIIEKYASALAHWQSAPDDGQASAINEGFKRCTGDVIAWLNSDDILFPGALMKVAEQFLKTPDAILAGDGKWYFETHSLECIAASAHITAEDMIKLSTGKLKWCQPGTFFPRTILSTIGLLDEKYRYVFDRDWMCRMLLSGAAVSYLGAVIAQFRFHSMSKTVGESQKWTNEQIRVTAQYSKELPSINFPFERAYIKVEYEALPHLSVL